MVGIVQVVNVLVMLLVVPMVNLIVAMDHVFMVHGHVMATQTVQMVLMKLTVLLQKNVLMTIVKMAHIGMAGLAIIVIIV